MWCKGMSYEDWEDTVSEETLTYLHGKCNEWAIQNYQNGDSFLVIYGLNEYFEVAFLIHCCLIRNGMYVDVRGETDDYDTVLESFDDEIIDDYTMDCEYETLTDFIAALARLGIT